MGLFSKKKKTKVETFSETTVEHKIIKLTYLQTMAVDGGVTNLENLSGQTEESDEELTADALTRAADGTIASRDGNFGKRKDQGTWLGGLAGSEFGKLFGKKTVVTVAGNIHNSGWRIVNTWLQPEFDKIRYALGIRELIVAQFRYEKLSEVISQPWAAPKDISKVTLIVDEFIPPQFPPGETFIEYYIKPELPDVEWIQINPLGQRTVFDSKGQIVPRIVNFNNEQPASTRLEEAYLETEGEVKQVRFRAVLKRPASLADSDVDADSYSPVLKSYRMLLTPRGGL